MKLEIGYNHPFEIRKYAYSSETLPEISLLYLSDLHFNRFSKQPAALIIAKINELNPSIILLGGDYADSQKGMHHFLHFMTSISHFKNIFSIPGNHDRWRLTQIRTIMENNNGTWLQNSAATIRIGNSTIRIDGGPPDTTPAAADLSILCLHKPIDVRKTAHHYNLIFAGHLHGSQVVLWSTDKGLYPGRFFYKWNRLSADLGHCRYLISKGLGDTLPIRYNCPKDALLIEVRDFSPSPNIQPEK